MTLRDDIRAVQRRLGVTPDGVPGPLTFAAMGRALDELAGFKAIPAAPAAGGSGHPPKPEILAGAQSAPELAANKGISNPDAFFASVRDQFGGLEQDQVDGLNALLPAMAAWPVSFVAYALATAWHETAATMQPIHERGGEAYLKRMYDIQGARPEKARELGNLSPGDGVKYAGRGYVQLTGKANYRKAEAALGLPLVANPDLALKGDVAARILVWGMEGGAFTGKKLGHYLPTLVAAGREPFKQARRIINGLDKADAIAEHALKMQRALQEGGWK
jgi:putative chitinase